jgi:hypothetical protein
MASELGEGDDTLFEFFLAFKINHQPDPGFLK